VSTLALKFRGPLIAVVVLLLSAGLALAGGGLTFPDVGSGGPDLTTDGTSQTADDGDNADDGDEATDEDEDGDNHGDLVSEAAQMTTPDGFRNHGAFVSCVARKLYEDPDADPAVEVVLAELTPEDCERDADAPEEEETDDPADEATDAWDNHGDMVSEAAQMVTPDGFGNHGAFVSCVAKMSYGKKGSEAPADFVLAELTPEDCAQAEADADAAKADKADKADKQKKDKSHGKGHGKGHGRGR